MSILSVANLNGQATRSGMKANQPVKVTQNR